MPTSALAIEVLILGALALWLLALVPAAVVTLMKDRLSLFFCGWLTFGITWIIGAVALAPPGSGWARRFYDEERLARASDPIRFGRSRRAVLLGCAGLLGAVAVLGLFAARPAPILGVNGRALQNSVSASSLMPSCERRGEGIWRCGRYDDQSSGVVAYRVSVHGRGCWSATRVGGPGEGSRKRLSGCVTIVDFLF